MNLVLFQCRCNISKPDEMDLCCLGSGEEMEESRVIRSRKLQSLKEEELSTATLRALFRLLDEDGSGEVSASEIRRGLILLGFEEAADPVALSRVVSDIDEDNTVG